MSFVRTRSGRVVLGVAVLALVAVVAAAVFVVVAIRNTDEHPPEITAYAYGETITVPPGEYCSFDLQKCTHGEIAELDVPAGEPLQLSLPKDIASAPWRMVMVYETPDGELEQQVRNFESGETDAVTVVSDHSPAWQLNGVEIQLPSAVIDENGLPLARAVWAIKTA